MASSFAVYFYSVYKPALNFFNNSPNLAWLISFFMPHAVVETSSVFINLHNIIVAIIALFGFLGFCTGAFHELRTPLAVIQTNLELVMANSDESVKSQEKWIVDEHKGTITVKSTVGVGTEFIILFPHKA